MKTANLFTVFTKLNAQGTYKQKQFCWLSYIVSCPSVFFFCFVFKINFLSPTGLAGFARLCPGDQYEASFFCILMLTFIFNRQLWHYLEEDLWANWPQILNTVIPWKILLLLKLNQSCLEMVKKLFCDSFSFCPHVFIFCLLTFILNYTFEILQNRFSWE